MNRVEQQYVGSLELAVSRHERNTADLCAQIEGLESERDVNVEHVLRLQNDLAQRDQRIAELEADLASHEAKTAELMKDLDAMIEIGCSQTITLHEAKQRIERVEQDAYDQKADFDEKLRAALEHGRAEGRARIAELEADRLYCWAEAETDPQCGLSLDEAIRHAMRKARAEVPEWCKKFVSDVRGAWLLLPNNGFDVQIDHNAIDRAIESITHDQLRACGIEVKQ